LLPQNRASLFSPNQSRIFPTLALLKPNTGKPVFGGGDGAPSDCRSTIKEHIVMAKKQTTRPVVAPPTPAAARELYRVRVARVVTAAGVTFKPRASYVVTPAVAAALGDAIASKEPA
jgi:hypothetical protein